MAVAMALRAYADKYSAVKVERIFMVGYPVAALLNVARDADLLVVVSRGHGAFSRLLLGSVSLGVLHLVARDVAVVPDRAYRGR